MAEWWRSAVDWAEREARRGAPAERERRIRLAVAALRTAERHLNEAERLTFRKVKRRPLERVRGRVEALVVLLLLQGGG